MLTGAMNVIAPALAGPGSPLEIPRSQHDNCSQQKSRPSPEHNPAIQEYADIYEFSILCAPPPIACAHTRLRLRPAFSAKRERGRFRSDAQGLRGPPPQLAFNDQGTGFGFQSL